MDLPLTALLALGCLSWRTIIPIPLSVIRLAARNVKNVEGLVLAARNAVSEVATASFEPEISPVFGFLLYRVSQYLACNTTPLLTSPTNRTCKRTLYRPVFPFDEIYERHSEAMIVKFHRLGAAVFFATSHV